MLVARGRQAQQADPSGASGARASGAGEQAQEVAAQAREQVQEKVQGLRGQASERVRSQLNVQSTRVGEQLSSFVQALHKAGEHLEGEGNGQGAKAVHRAAGQAERLAGYLRQADGNRLLADIERVSRGRPWVTGGLGAAVGFVAARFLKASSEGRYESGQERRKDADLPIGRERQVSAGDLTSALPSPPVAERSR